MAQLKSTVVQGSLRVTDTTYTTTAQLSILNAPTSDGTSFGPGTADYVLMSNGKSVYWGTGATNALKALDVSIVGNTNGTKYIAAVSQADGKISATAVDVATTYSATGTTAISGKGVAAALATLDGNLNSTTPGAGKTLTAFSQTDGKVSATFGNISISASQAGLGNVSNNANLNNTTGAKGDIIYWSAANTPSHLTNTSSTTKNFLSITSQVPAWTTLSKSDVGLGNVTNDAQIPKSVGTAKGDMIYFTANATPTRLAIGTAGSILNATSNGPAWTDAIEVVGTGTTRKITLNDRLFGVDNYNIGTALPQTGENNQIFFQISEPFYELPLDGKAGMVLAKVTEDARNTAWTNVLTYNYDIKNLNDTDNGSISRVRIIDPDSTTASTSVSLQWNSDNKRGVLDNAINKWLLYIDPGDNYAHCGTRLYGAVWNDYAEYRISSDNTPGRVVQECGDDTLKLSTARLLPGCNIISDTYGFAIGQTSRANVPIAISGRVLAYPYESIDEFKNNIGKPVCSGPNGTVSIMSDEEYQQYGYCCIGTISAIPNYETWGEDNIAVRGRVWIQVR